MLRALAPSANSERRNRVRGKAEVDPLALRTFVERARTLFADTRSAPFANIDPSADYFGKSFSAASSAEGADADAGVSSGLTSSPESARIFPVTDDYNMVFDWVAQAGELPSIISMMQIMPGRNRAAASAGPEELKRIELGSPNARTFEILMLGVYRHIEIAQQTLRRETKRVERGRGSKAKASFQQSALVHTLEQTKRNSAMAASCCTALFDVMRSSEVAPTTLTLDIAARVYRMAGEMPLLQSLLQKHFGFDLANPGSSPAAAATGSTSEIRPLTVHTLNTIVTALAEHGTASQMVVAYECLTRQLSKKADGSLAEGWWDEEDDTVLGGGSTVAAASTEAEVPKGSVFKLDWKAFSQRPPPGDAGSPADLSQVAALGPVQEPPRTIQPNHRTFKTMLTALFTPTRATSAGLQSTTGKDKLARSRSADSAGRSGRSSQRSALRQQEEENQRREKGDYLLLARALLREALDMLHESTKQIEAISQDVGSRKKSLPEAISFKASHELLLPIYRFASTKRYRPTLLWIKEAAAEMQSEMEQQRNALHSARGAAEGPLRGALETHLVFLDERMRELEVFAQERLAVEIDSLAHSRIRRRDNAKVRQAEARQQEAAEAARKLAAKAAREAQPPVAALEAEEGTPAEDASAQRSFSTV